MELNLEEQKQRFLPAAERNILEGKVTVFPPPYAAVRIFMVEHHGSRDHGRSFQLRSELPGAYLSHAYGSLVFREDGSMVANTYKNNDMSAYKKIFSGFITETELVSGSGIWFEPKTYEGDIRYKAEPYVSPYWYRDGSNIVEDWSYSNAEYDYFNQEYYLLSKAQTTTEAIITDPYYDPVSDTIMATCASAIYNSKGEYLGCVTVDINFESVVFGNFLR